MVMNNINPKDIIFSLDIGTRTVIGTVGIVREKKFQVISEFCVEHEQRAMLDGQIHDINLVAKAVNSIKTSLEKELQVKLTNVAIAAAGRFLRTVEVKAEIEVDENKEIDKEVVRGLELTAVKMAEEKLKNQTAGKLYCVGYSVKNYYLNGYVISNLASHKGENISTEIIATFLPRSVVDSLYSVMDKVSLNVTSLTLEPIAAIEAAIPQSLRLLNLALVDIGAGTSDIAISNKDSISAYGMASIAGDEVTEAISQNYLVDFNTAERIKKEVSTKEEISFTDVIGMENTIKSEEVFKVIEPIVDKLGEEISTKIVELNGGKSPNAVFLVGGGAHTPGLKDIVANKLNLSLQRIAIKGREAVTECTCKNKELGSVGVTVLGIALVAIKKSGNDFIDVTLNDSVVSLFNSHKHTVMDVIMQAGLSPKVLLGKNGHNIKFTLNGHNRVAFGEIAKSATITINGVDSGIDSEVREGDKINIQYAKNGEEARPKILDYVRKVDSISFYLNDEIKNMEPICVCNNNIVNIETIIKDKDNIEVIYPSTLGELKKYYLKHEDKEAIYYLNDEIISDDYEIKEGDKIYREDKTINVEEPKENIHECNNDLNSDNNVKNEDEEIHEENDITGNLHNVNVENKIDKKVEKQGADETVKDQNNNSKIDEEIISKDIEEDQSEIGNEESTKQSEELNYKKDINAENEIEVLINNNLVKLKGKEKYVFIDIFDYIDFDLTRVHGKLVLDLNDSHAEFHDEIKTGDKIKVAWE